MMVRISSGMELGSSQEMSTGGLGFGIHVIADSALLFEGLTDRKSVV